MSQTQEDVRRWITKVAFVGIVLCLLGYLHFINAQGQYDELIVGIIGLFMGIASTAAKDLISSGGESEIEMMQNRIEELERIVEVQAKEVEIYKGMVMSINEKLVSEHADLMAERLKTNNE